MKTNIFDVANFILQNMGEISAIKLQRLVYYSQAWSLAWDGAPLFNENFEAWNFGPVSPILYDHFKNQLKVCCDMIDANLLTNTLTPDQKETIEIVIDLYGSLPNYSISQIVYKEQPWLFARGDTLIGESCTNLISKKSMIEYYSSFL